MHPDASDPDRPQRSSHLVRWMILGGTILLVLGPIGRRSWPHEWARWEAAKAYEFVLAGKSDDAMQAVERILEAGDWLAPKSSPSETVAFLDRLKAFGFRNATRGGVSIGIEDLEIPGEKETLLEEATARVERFLKFTDRDPNEVLGVLLPDSRAATIWSVAVNGVMAGCRPEYMPVLIAAVEGMCDPKYGVEHSGNTPGGDTLKPSGQSTS